MTFFKKASLTVLLMTFFTFSSCSKDDDVPDEENDLEVITDVTLVFINTLDSSDVVKVLAQDPDGIGVEELQIVDQINLDADTTYTLTLEVMNNLEEPGESITEEIEEEGAEHQVFFSFSNNAFSDPLGNGNIDNANDPINYNDLDENENPIGISTNWSTASTTLTGGTFTIRLQHQPDIKTESTGANDGDTDFELEFVLNIL